MTTTTTTARSSFATSAQMGPGWGPTPGDAAPTAAPSLCEAIERHAAGCDCYLATDDGPETCTCGGCPRCGGCLVPMDADLLPCEDWTCFCDLV